MKIGTIGLGDARLDRRCNQLIDQFMKRPTMSIPEACGNWKSTKAAYRFFSNSAVQAEKIMQAQYKETSQRIRETDAD
jgi:Transposase DNA-binding